MILVISNSGNDPGNDFSALVKPTDSVAGKRCYLQLVSFATSLTLVGYAVEVRLTTLAQQDSYDSRTGLQNQTVGLYQNHLVQNEQPSVLVNVPTGPFYASVKVYNVSSSTLLEDTNDNPPDTTVLLLKVTPEDD